MPAGTIDLRSDTVTRPTPAMREAMANADVGDDVFGEDPTVNRLEATAAARMGKAAALLVPSGTMANLVAVLTHATPGDEILLGDQAHIVRAEVGGVSRLGGLLPTTIPNEPDGGLSVAAITKATRGANVHHPPTTLLALENTHNFCGGSVLSLERMQELTAPAHALGLRVHLDGARIFNAQTAIGVPAAELAAGADSVCFCLSKGLGAPVGSLVCGSAKFIERARKTRKILGGGMRQAGVIAAAGLVALEQMVERLGEDHANARRLTRGLADLGFAVNPEQIETNIVVVPSDDAPALRDRAAAAGVLITVLAADRARFVTHHDVSEADIDDALERLAEVPVAVPR